jgi:predicted metalloprotease
MCHRLLVAALALCALVAPLTVSAQTTVDLVVNDIDAFWAQQFANPYFSPGAYCAADQTVYYSTAWAPNDPAAEILWWTVLSHEWGHHIQWQVDTGVSTTMEAELQADCFAGAYMSHAEAAGLVSPDSVSMALSLTQSAGDVWFFLPDDAPEHGNKAERALAFMQGLNGGVADCGFAG